MQEEYNCYGVIAYYCFHVRANIRKVHIGNKRRKRIQFPKEQTFKLSSN